MSVVALAPERPALVLDATDRAPALARRYLAVRFAELGCADAYVGQVVVTELVTNSYKHVGFGRIVVRVLPEADEGLVLIEVADDGGGLPIVREAADDALCGRGLLLMVRLVSDWGVRPLDGGGKVVWARCAR
ncbi:ATP-binding protein [Actinomadura syzygii]|uniref:ATP-binding protein n=1 Tax=Actinomadura syzygii TaxID=1427538 RepID=A0A5D0UM66_9ACTN|nr:ATP-binding protein [Actinomadura syzygii]TYC18722.1 ATP-binding protein [Actinomadura syzygii]